MTEETYVVVGGRNATFLAAHAARESGDRVLVLEKAPQERAGGNAYFTAGAFRTTFGGIDDLRPLLYDPEDERLSCTDLSPHTEEDFPADMGRVTQGRCDEETTRVLVEDAAEAMAARAGHPVSAGVRSAVVPRPWEVEVLGRFGARDGRRRQRVGEAAHRCREQKRDQSSVREPGGGLAAGR